MSKNLTEFPLDARRINEQAAALDLYDLKTWSLGLLMEEVGLADPERYVWTLMNRLVTTTPVVTNYVVITRNFDPVTLSPTPYVNGILYTYTIPIPEPSRPSSYAVASTATVDPLAIGYNSAAGIADSGDTTRSSYSVGVFFTGLTRDDVGAIRYLLKRQNINVENLIAGTTGSGGSSPWSIPGLGAATNVVLAAPRPGVDKILFKQINFYAGFVAYTNSYTDTYQTNGVLRTQRVQRIQTAPDILFDAGTTPFDGATGEPDGSTRTTTVAWINNGALNNPSPTTAEHDGPGVIQPTVVITFSTSGPWILNQYPNFLTQFHFADAFGGWAAFDGTTNAPVLFPNGASIEALEQQILSTGF
jgi:hypothetical protein